MLKDTVDRYSPGPVRRLLPFALIAGAALAYYWLNTNAWDAISLSNTAATILQSHKTHHMVVRVTDLFGPEVKAVCFIENGHQPYERFIGSQYFSPAIAREYDIDSLSLEGGWDIYTVSPSGIKRFHFDFGSPFEIIQKDGTDTCLSSRGEMDLSSGKVDGEWLLSVRLPTQVR